MKLLNHQNSDDIIHLWLNKQIEIHDFDADPGWLGPKRMNQLSVISSSAERMKLIEQERHKGSMPMELFLRLKKHEQTGRLQLHHSPIDEVRSNQIISEGHTYPYQHILLATGFVNQLGAQPFVRALIHEEDAPLNECGYPSLTYDLEWLPQLFVMGGLADLELGPFARNIMGGKEGAERISKALSRLSKKIS